MKKKSLAFSIFCSSFFIGIFVYFICAVCFVSVMYRYFESEVFNDLKNETYYIEKYIENGKASYLSELESLNRITLIHSDGTVYYDSSMPAEEMENHLLRTEVYRAFENGEAKISRYSSTMAETTLYYARCISNGDVIRVSDGRYSIFVLFLGMGQVFLILLLVAAIAASAAGIWLSKKIAAPLNKIDLDNPDSSSVYREVEPLLERIEEENFEKKQREEIRRQYTANVSHELKTPLTSISGFAEILRTGEASRDVIADFADSIYTESQRMISLVNDIIKLSKLDEKSIAMEKEALSLKEIVAETFQVLRSTAEIKNIKMEFSGESGFINGVRPVIYEMVYNLIDNAIKYNRINGSVFVSIASRHKNGHSGNDESTVILTVRDTGIGIPYSERDRIFERFYRIDKSRSKELGGTGLGLSIVKHAAKYHDAAISLQSEEGKGSEFTVTFRVNGPVE